MNMRMASTFLRAAPLALAVAAMTATLSRTLDPPAPGLMAPRLLPIEHAYAKDAKGTDSEPPAPSSLPAAPTETDPAPALVPQTPAGGPSAPSERELALALLPGLLEMGVTVMPMSARDDGRAVLDAVNGMRRQQGLPPFERVDQALADYVDIALDLYRERLDNVLRMQIALDALGFNPGPIDGLLGPRTTAAIKKYQQTTAMPITGQLTDEQIDALEASSMDRVMAKKPGG
jgi:hypothetical protein